MPEFTVNLTDDEVASLLALAEKRGIDPNAVVQQAIVTEKLIADNVGEKDELLIRRGDSDKFAKVLFGPAR